MTQSLHDERTEGVPVLRCIGKGACGTVWAASRDGPAFKREDGSPSRTLINDAEMHQRVLKAFQTFKNQSGREDLTLRVPLYERYIEGTDSEWWRANIKMFPQEIMPCNMIQSQRIPPFGEAVRKLLINHFCPRNAANAILASDENKDCLIRPYLGRRRTQTTNQHSRFVGFSLRNFPLHVDQMEELNFEEAEIHQYGRDMAKALAIMHWVGEVDANDVEFVLAPKVQNEAMDSLQPLGKHCIWILDFDLCRNITMDLEGVKQAVLSFWGNDPYFPRPVIGDSSSSVSLWHSFRGQYLETSSACFVVHDKEEAIRRYDLSRKFIQMVEEECLRRKK